MPTFELHVRSKPDGSFAAAWFDDASYLWNDERLGSPTSLADSWATPELQLLKPEAGATSVLFNPNALAVSEGLRDELGAFPELEFLPVQISGHGRFFLLHVTAAIEVPTGMGIRVAPQPSGNIVGIDKFPSEFAAPHAFFRVLQPVDAAARRLGRTTRATFLSEAGKSAIEKLAEQYLEVRPA